MRRAWADPHRGAMARRDPICGRDVEPDGAAARLEYKGRPYLFCSEHCRRDFERHAERLQLGERARAGTLLSGDREAWGQA